MWLNESTQYKHLALESVKKLETQLERDLDELKSEIEINELVHGIRLKRQSSSIQAPKDAKNVAIERKLYIEKLLKVHDSRPIYIQADVLREQIENASKSEYKLDTLPILLHQFFINRISSCVQAKHAHLLRWKRFSQHTSVIEEMYPDFKNRVGYILSEYNDAVQRAERLGSARDALLSTGSCTNALLSMQTDDFEVYIRWLISHFYSIKSYVQFMKLLEWFPYLITKLNEPTKQSLEQEYIEKKQKQLQQQQQDLISIKSATSFSLSKAEDPKLYSESQRYFGVIDKLYLESTNAIMPTDDILNAISFLFNEGELPMLNNSMDYLLPRLRYFVNYYHIDYNLSRMQTSGDEMELFAAVNRRFRHLFAQQEHMKAFRLYDMIEIGHENWGADSPIHALKKESNWVKYIQFVPFKDANYEKAISRMRNKNRVDELLASHNAFIDVNNDERVQYALRENAPYVKAQPVIEPVSVTTNKTSFNSMNYWKKIFNSMQMREKSENEEIYLPGDLENSINKAPKALTFGGKHVGKKTNEFNYMENLQKYGLDDSNSNDQNLTGIQGSYLSYLLLRHLRLRDLKRQALGVLNYFRSIERTLTIYDGGLSFEGDSAFKRQSAQNHAKETSSGDNLGNHAYIYNTPKDFKLSEIEFMEFAEIDNHDDFYCTDENDNVHVQDQRGYYIVYDVAVSDLKKLEDELLLICSFFIEKQRESESANKNKQYKRKATAVPTSSSPDLVDLTSYSHQSIDRFAVLCDVWTNEVNFLEMKRKLLDCYYEAYQNVFDNNERRNLAQRITDIMYQRPRLDLEMPYFVNTYRLEISCLYQQSKIIRLLVDRMIKDMREFSTKLNGQVKFGLPYPIIEKHLISTNLNEAQLNNVYMLEFHPELGVISRIPEAFRHTIEDIVYKKNMQSVHERLVYERYFYENLYDQFLNLDTPGYGYTPQIQRDLFNGMFVEDPLFMDDLAQGLLRELDEALKNRTRKEQTEMTVSTLARVADMVSLRHRLVSSAVETEILAKAYIKQANEMGFDNFHLYMRYIQFDFSKFKDDAGKAPPMFVTELSMEDSKVDRYIPNNLYLAVQELEEAQIGRFSFRGKDNILNLLRPNGIENLQIVLKLQLAHNAALIGAIMQSYGCALSRNLAVIPTKDSSAESEKSKDVLDSGMKDTPKINLTKTKPYSESFVSIQMEKIPSRDLMLNEYLKQKESKALILSNPNEMEKLKRTIMNDFVNRFTKRAYQSSLRAQLITLYYSITKILESFPNTRENHFVFGEPFEKRNLATQQQQNKDSTTPVVIPDEFADELRHDPKVFRKRPRKLLSDDGKRVLNIWFIPHYMELLVQFKKQSDDVSCQALRDSVRIISALNDILNLIYANACLSTDSNSQARRRNDFSSWENAGGIGGELSEIQHELNALDNPCDPEQVARLLEARRSSLMLQYECAIRHSVREVFLSAGNTTAYRTVTENMHFALRYLSEYPVNSFDNVYMELPDPLDARDAISKQMFPWHASMSKNGPFPTQYWQWFQIEPCLSLSLSGLKDVEKNIANGEILGIHLLLEDILTLFNDADAEIFKEGAPKDDAVATATALESDSSVNITEKKVMVVENTDDHLFSAHTEARKPLEAYAKVQYFLLSWKRLENLKIDWARRRMLIDKISDSTIFAEFSEKYAKDILLPVIRTLARRVDARDFLDTNNDEKKIGPIMLPKGVSELESKYKQIARLLEKLESSMINETTHRIQKEMRLVFNERGREETALSTDLWKRSAMKEEFTTNKPHMVDEFCNMFYKSAKINESTGERSYTISEGDLKHALVKLGCLVQERERSNYEQYTMFYENLLRQKHQLLYAREREVLSVKESMQNKINEMDIEVKCQMTEACYDLIMEVTALRAKIQELNIEIANKENEVREKVKIEFMDLVTDLVNVNSRLRTQFDTYKESVFSNVLDLVARCRTEAFEMATNLKKKSGSRIDEMALHQQLNQAKLISDLQMEQHQLNNLLIKQRALTKLKLNRVIQRFMKELINVNDHASKQKAKATNIKLMSEEREILFNQEKTALEKQLKKLDVDFNNLKTKLDKEIQEKQSRDHEAQQRMKNEKSLHAAKQSNVDKIFEELESKDVELRNLYITTEKSTKMQTIVDAKLHKEMTTIRKQLAQERNLKLDAFQKVDDLQAQVFDLEDEITNIVQIRPQTSKDVYNRNSRLLSACSNRTKYSSPFPRLNAQQAPTPQPAAIEAAPKSQRPKTANVRMKQLSDSSYNTDKDSLFHEQIAKLKQIRLKSAVSQS